MLFVQGDVLILLIALFGNLLILLVALCGNLAFRTRVSKLERQRNDSEHHRDNEQL